jgi:ectoine utilization protein EutD
MAAMINRDGKETIMQPFETSEYRERIRQAKARMAQRELDTLLVADPANMNYLTGYDGWSFYTPQLVIVAQDRDEPICITRLMDANGAKLTTFLDHANIVGYPDRYVQSTERHPMDYVAEMMRERRLDRSTIGLEMDAYYFTPSGYEALRHHLPNARFADSRQLVNWLRAVKSPREIAYMKDAARIMDKTMAAAVEMVRPGVRQCDAVAAIYQAQITGTAEFGGDYTSFVPMLPSGRGTSTPHLTWSDQPFVAGEATILELAAARHHYHCPMARTVFLGKPPQKIIDTTEIVLEGTAAASAAAKPGATAEAVEAAWRQVIARHGIVKESRIGYSVGLNYPPDWGEHTISLRPGDRTVLQANMTLHVIPGIWMDDWGIEISECVHITETGARPFANFPRQLFVKA